MRDLTLRAVDTKASLGLLLFLCFLCAYKRVPSEWCTFNICWATNVTAAVPQMLNIVSCDVERWNMPFNISWWTKIELGSIPFNELTQQQQLQWCEVLYEIIDSSLSTTTTTITFIQVEKMFNICCSVKGNDVEPCIIRFINLFMEFDFYCSFLLPLLQLLNRVPCPLHLCDETKRVVKLFSAKCLTCIHRVTWI